MNYLFLLGYGKGEIGRTNQQTVELEQNSQYPVSPTHIDADACKIEFIFTHVHVATCRVSAHSGNVIVPATPDLSRYSTAHSPCDEPQSFSFLFG